MSLPATTWMTPMKQSLTIAVQYTSNVHQRYKAAKHARDETLSWWHMGR